MLVTLKYNTLNQYLKPDILRLKPSDSLNLGNERGERRLRKNSFHQDPDKDTKVEDFINKADDLYCDMKLKNVFTYRKEKFGGRKLGKKGVKRHLHMSLEKDDTLVFEKLLTHQEQTKEKLNGVEKALFISDVKFFDLDMKGYVCGFCFKCFEDCFQFDYHCQITKCRMDFSKKDDDSVIYDDKAHSIKIRRLDGLLDANICGNLTKLGKAFISSKLNNIDDIIKFEFFLLYQEERFVGYFSREKNSLSWNLCCILTLPSSERFKCDNFAVQYGQFLIHFAYQLSILQLGNLGTAEKPFSDLGLLAFRKYYKYRLLKFLLEEADVGRSELTEIPLWEISRLTGMVKNDLIFALEALGDFEYNKTLKKVKVKTAVLEKWKESESYKAWRQTIDLFSFDNFTALFKLCLKEDGSEALVSHDINSIKMMLIDSRDEDWERVSVPTEKYLYSKVNSGTHERYLERLEKQQNR